MAEQWYRLSIYEDEGRGKNPMWAEREGEWKVKRYTLEKGEAVEDWDPETSYCSPSAEHDGIPEDVLHEIMGLPVFSLRLREALEREKVAEGDIQYLPVRVFQSTGEEVMGFAVANILTRPPALNRKNSELLSEEKDEIDPLTGKLKVSGIWTAALNTEGLAGHDMIRLLEFFPPIFVSRRFVEVYRDGGFTGAVFNKAPCFGAT